MRLVRTNDRVRIFASATDVMDVEITPPRRETMMVKVVVFYFYEDLNKQGVTYASNILLSGV